VIQYSNTIGSVWPGFRVQGVSGVVGIERGKLYVGEAYNDVPYSTFTLRHCGRARESPGLSPTPSVRTRRYRRASQTRTPHCGLSGRDRSLRR